MPKDRVKIAVYTRKSKYSDKSESIASQLEYCRQAAAARYPGSEIEFSEYVDEGFSGGTTERPEYKRLLRDLRRERPSAVICYKIDRLSRSLADFTDLQKSLEEYGVNVISASEGFDTSTAWGQAVLNILMIFAQLERNNVSERVRDTMLHYGRQGRWTGGVPPTGFKSARKAYADAFGQKKEMCVLEPVEEELEGVRLIFKRYREQRSLCAVAASVTGEGVRTKNGKRFTAASVRDILTNPVYASADESVYRYFSEAGAEIIGCPDDFDGTRSLLPYNREDKKKSGVRPVSEWVLALSAHGGAVSGKEWVSVQRILAQNADRRPRLGTSGYGVFSGLIFCARCGGTMRVKKGRGKGFYYVCRTKERGGSGECNVPNIAGHFAEPQIIESIEKFTEEHGLLGRFPIAAPELSDYRSRKEYERLLRRKEREIENLVNQAARTSEEIKGKYITKRIGELHEETRLLRGKAAGDETEMPEEEYEEIERSLTQIAGALDKIEGAKAKRALAMLLVERLEWDGEALYITFRQGAARPNADLS